MNVLLVFHPQNPVIVWVYPQNSCSQLKHPQVSKKSFYSLIYEIKPFFFEGFRSTLNNFYQLTFVSRFVSLWDWQIIIWTQVESVGPCSEIGVNIFSEFFVSSLLYKPWTVPGFPMRDCAGSCNSLVSRIVKVSTGKMWQQRQSLSVCIWFQDVRQFMPRVKYPCAPTPPPLTFRLFLDFDSIFPRVGPFFLVSTMRVPGRGYRDCPDYLVNHGQKKMRGDSGKKSAHKSRNSFQVNGRSCGCTRTADTEHNFAQSWNQIQTLKICHCCHIYCV